MPPVLHRQAEARRHRGTRRALRAALRTAQQEVLSNEKPAADRLGTLRAAKLCALAGAQWGAEPIGRSRAGSFPGGATLVEGGTGRAWVLIDDGDPTSLGPALVWASRHHVARLHVLVDDAVAGRLAGVRGVASDGPLHGAVAPSAVVARRAAEWAAAPEVWRVEGRVLIPATAATPPDADPPPAEAEALAGMLTAHGVEAIFEHGVLTGEVLGLEVARATAGPDGWRLRVGVGRLDRVARTDMRPGEPDGAAIDDVARVVRTWRRAGAARHPANTLARERWLRAVVVARPILAGAATLRPVAPPLPRGGIRQASAAPAEGTAVDGSPVVVVCSTGVDVDLVPTAADTRRLRSTVDTCRLVLVVPDGDDYPVTRALAASLRRPAEVRTVPADWMLLTPTV